MRSAERAVLLSDAATVAIGEIGGKAFSLARLVAAGFRVPAGAVLPASWFRPWWDELARTSQWNDFVEALGQGAPLREPCLALQGRARNLECTGSMQQVLADLSRQVTSWGTAATCAVRSSSPEEDLASVSFAGGYETLLGVTPSGLEAAVRACFASALDERVMVYKRQHGLDPGAPKIAVLVQRQIASEVAGVGFSLNPLTNDFDEAVIEANFGLGDTVVSGEVSPDQFVVDKPRGEILERRLGSKAVSRWLRPGGGLETREEARGGESTLSDPQVLELARLIEGLEEFFGHPVDVEWAYGSDGLELLQARPVTSYMPLPLEMQTEPGQRRRLYADGALSDGPTTNRPLTRLSLESFDWILQRLAKRAGVPDSPGNSEEGDLLVMAGARPYADFSKILWWIAPSRLVGLMELADGLAARAIREIDRDRYRPERCPKVLSPAYLLRSLLGGLWGLRRAWWNGLRAFVAGPAFLAGIRARGREYEREIAEFPPDAPIARLRALSDRFTDFLVDFDVPAIMPWLVAGAVLEEERKKAAGSDAAVLLDSMQRGYEGELVVDMGIAMFAMTRLIDRSEFDDIDELARKIRDRVVPDEFLRAWEEFLARYGSRGPLEMELRSPRYGDTPRILLGQLASIAKAPPESDPGLANARAIAERGRATDVFLEQRRGLSRWWLRRIAGWIDGYASERDTPKHHWVLLATLMRRNALVLGERLVDEQRLDEAADVFHLQWADLEAAQEDSTLDLRPLARKHRGVFLEIESRITEFPMFIDSRGRILRPRSPASGTGLEGIGIAPGVARGPVKVLHNPYDKSIEPGDVLVAYTTDPGWTPLFINAAAIILQVGGVMQHGGVVAREYGKPCVAGIDGVLSRFRDGQVVEVDGANGRVRIVSDISD